MIDPQPNPASALRRTASAEPASQAWAGARATDAALLLRVKDSDESAMTEIFDRYGTMIYSVALRVLHDPGQAEDVMQEILIQVWKNAAAYVAGRGSLGDIGTKVPGVIWGASTAVSTVTAGGTTVGDEVANLGFIRTAGSCNRTV